MSRLQELLTSPNLTPVQKQLINTLRAIWDHEGFMAIAVVTLETDEQRQKLLDIMEQENLTGYDDTDEITYIALDIADGLL